MHEILSNWISKLNRLNFFTLPLDFQFTRFYWGIVYFAVIFTFSFCVEKNYKWDPLDLNAIYRFSGTTFEKNCNFHWFFSFTSPNLMYVWLFQVCEFGCWFFFFYLDYRVSLTFGHSNLNLLFFFFFRIFLKRKLSAEFNENNRKRFEKQKENNK